MSRLVDPATRPDVSRRWIRRHDFRARNGDRRAGSRDSRRVVQPLPSSVRIVLNVNQNVRERAAGLVLPSIVAEEP
jgi:hypothetical protein